MSVETKNPLFSGPAISLLRAVGVRDDFTGSARVIHQATSCIRAASEVWPTDAFTEWRSIAEATVRTLTAASSQTTASTLHLFLTPDSMPEQQHQFLNYRAPTLKVGSGYQAHALIGRALVIAATTGQPLPVDFLGGIQTLARAREGKGRRTVDWDHFLKTDLTDSQALLTISKSLPDKSPAARFAKFTTAILNTLVLTPGFRQERGPISSMVGAEHADGENEGRTYSPIKVDKPDSLAIVEAHESLPDISNRFAGADYTSFSEKLGLPHRDQLLVDDLAFVTSKFQRFMKEGTPEVQGFTVLAAISLVTGWSDKIALKLGFGPDRNNWLDLEKGAWAWDFQAYRASKGGSSSIETSEPIYCPWPAFLDQTLQQARQTAPETKTLENLILAIQGIDQFDLKKYREFLRACGHPAHPPYAGRFARSLSTVYLEVTGSDMTAGLMTGFVAAVAPAALFYFGPLYTTLLKRISSVYDRLGLGPPSALFVLTERAGCQKLLGTDDLQAGWRKLTDEINRVRRLSEQSVNDEQRRIHCNRWMALLGTSFVIQTGHRGSRLECLTVGALHTHPGVVLIHDKDEGGRAQPRLVPKTEALKQLLLGASECRRMMEHANTPNETVNSRLDLCAAVFLQWTLETVGESAACLSTATVNEITQEFFSSTANFARSQWVTYLDQYGCDRWLIRALTGHTRDVSRTHGPYLDIPALTMAARLGVEMEKVGSKIFGNTAIDVTDACLPGLSMPTFKPRVTKYVHDGPAPDPRTVLDPLSETTMGDWNTVERIRKDLFAGHIDAPAHALAVLHLAFVDQIPLGQACLDAVRDRSGFVKAYGRRRGVLWHRPHFVHPTWIPVQTTTGLLLDRLIGPPPPSYEIIKQVCRAVRAGGYGVWPSNDAGFFEIITQLGVSYRRLSFPPSMAAVSDLAVPAPCLSALSLHRLCGDEVPPLPPQLMQRANLLKSTVKSEDWRFLVSTLNKYSSKVERLGEKRARAIGCLADLRNSDILWMPFSSWLRDWAIDELQRSRAGVDGCYQVSSISTYLSTLGCAQTAVDTADDPADWEELDWVGWVEEVNRCSAPMTSPAPTTEIKIALNERAKPALNALVTSLLRRHESVPWAIRSLLGFQPKKTVCRNSASSTLILKADHARSIDILKDWHEDSPADFLLAEFRATVSGMIPCRAGDVSSLKTICLTPGGGLVFERAGYDVHKTRSAIRLIPLAAEDAQELEQKIQKLHEHFGDRPLLLRGDGSHAAGLRDQRLANDFGLALKVSTADPRARPHSVRAATLQESAWPGWQEHAYKFLNAEAGPARCNDWVNKTAEFPLRLSRAVATAGQSDLRSAFGNYLAAWSIVYAIHCTGSLIDLSPEPAFLAQLGLSSSNLRKARSRHPTQSNDLVATRPAFDTQRWIELQAAKMNTPRFVALTAITSTSNGIEKTLPTVASAAQFKTTSMDQLTYLAVRALGLSQARALEKVVIPRSLAAQLDLHLPSEDSIASAVSRARQGPESRGQVADIDMALSSTGKVALTWLCTLDHEDFMAFKTTVFKAESTSNLMLKKVAIFEKLARALPEVLHISCRFGAKHLDTREKCALALLAPAFTFSTDPRLGKRPVVSMSIRGKQNLVVSARLTSVVRVYTLVVEAFRLYRNGAEHAA